MLHALKYNSPSARLLDQSCCTKAEALEAASLRWWYLFTDSVIFSFSLNFILKNPKKSSFPFKTLRNQLIRRPAKVLGLQAKKGSLEVGFDLKVKIMVLILEFSYIRSSAVLKNARKKIKDVINPFFRLVRTPTS